jgi:2-polyprenyl-3-methyl-5-hydroxy-6-metoxy-1,4-benzoquinol methylase
MKKCSLCSEVNTKVVFSASPLDYSLDRQFQIAKCGSCGHGSTQDIGYLPEAYEGGSYDVKEKVWHSLINPFLSYLENNKVSYLNNHHRKRVLEIGCGKGRFINALIKNGFDAHGIEPSLRSYEEARKRGYDKVFNCTIQQLHTLPELNKKFDFIVLWHVLEHLENPQNIIAQLKEFLSPAGSLIIAVPNFNSWQAIYGKSDWYHLDPSRHLSHFTEASLHILAQKNSLAVRKIFFNSFYQDLTGEIITFTNKFSSYKNPVFNVLRKNKNFFKSAGKAGAIGSFIWALFLSVILLPFLIIWTVLSQRLKKSGTMVAVIGYD